MRASGALLALCALALVAGCAARAPRPTASSQANEAVEALSSRSYLYSLPEMREAYYHRRVGAHHMERAYRCQRVLDREWNFQMAMGAFERATEAYHHALAAAPMVYAEVIEREVDTVAMYMQQIYHDQQPSWGP